MKKLLRHPTIRMHLKQGFKFGISGLTGFILEISTLTFCVEVLHFSPALAKLPSVVVSVTFVYFFNKYVTFRNKGRDVQQTIRFIIVYSCAVVLSYIIFVSFVHVGVQYQLAQVITTAIIAFFNYAFSHGFIFKKRNVVEEMPIV